MRFGSNTFTTRQVLNAKNRTRQITNQKFYKVSVFQSEYVHCVTFQKKNFKKILGFESEHSQRVSFWIRSFTTCRIINRKFNKVSDFKGMLYIDFTFWIKFLTYQISNQIIRNVTNSETKNNNTSEFESKALQLVGF